MIGNEFPSPVGRFAPVAGKRPPVIAVSDPVMLDATAIETSRVLRIDKEEFIDVLADNVQITQGVLKAMVRRLRALGRSVQARGS